MNFDELFAQPSVVEGTYAKAIISLRKMPYFIHSTLEYSSSHYFYHSGSRFSHLFFSASCRQARGVTQATLSSIACTVQIITTTTNHLHCFSSKETVRTVPTAPKTTLHPRVNLFQPPLLPVYFKFSTKCHSLRSLFKAAKPPQRQNLPLDRLPRTD